MDILYYFIVGICLLALELFVPGGILGIIGYLCIMWGLYDLLGHTMETVLILLGISLVLSIVLLIVVNYFPQTWFGRHFTLNLRFTSDTGYTSNERMFDLVGKKGVAHTVLRPSGTARIDDMLVDVVTEGDFISAGTPIVVYKVLGSRIIVRMYTNVHR